MSVTLHDEIGAILRESGKSLTSKQVAEIANRRRIYLRGDGKPMPASQVRARANNYTRLFQLDGSLIGLKQRVDTAQEETVNQTEVNPVQLPKSTRKRDQESENKSPRSSIESAQMMSMPPLMKSMN